MQTFLPYPSYRRSAEVLDHKRLGKQRVEAKQIYTSICDPARGWQSHPAVNMWRGYEGSLLEYGRIVCEEWRSRGFRDTLLDFFESELPRLDSLRDPHWLGRRRLHESHQSNLLRKDPKFYAAYGWRVGPDLPYYWPV